MCIIFRESHSSFCTAIPGAERGPFDLEALAEGADTVFTMLISSSSNYQLALISSQPFLPPAFTCFVSFGSHTLTHLA